MKNIFTYRSPGNKKNLLLHYKSISSNFHKIDNKHTNNWEISEMIRIFIALGWNVELVDRRCKNWSPSSDYDLFISNASGSLGSFFVKMSEQIPDVKTVMYAAGPAVDVSDTLVDERYDNFRLRHGIAEDTRHLRTFRTDIDTIMHFVDEVICIDDNGFSSKTYKRFKKPIHKLQPSSPRDSFDGQLRRFNKNRSGFLLFLGNGFIAKGADVVLDVFKNFPNAHLQVCGPYKQDEFFWSFYKSKLRNMKNVTLNGFVRVGSRRYFNLVEQSAWQIHNSAAEGCATSVTTLLQSGIVPISNYETGVDVRDFGIEISNWNRNFLESTQEAIDVALSVSDSSFKNYIGNLYFSAKRFTQNAFRTNFAEIIQKII